MHFLMGTAVSAAATVTDATNHADTAWILASSALVLLMTPGLAFFYGGMVRGKNVLGMLAQNFVTMGMVSILWITGVYSLAFNGTGGLIGNLHLSASVGPLSSDLSMMRSPHLKIKMENLCIS